MEFEDREIEGVEIRDLIFFNDERGWLAELFRQDDIDESLYPLMSYVSMTKSGIQRGPHAHEEQTDYFIFYSSKFKVVLWDGRANSRTYRNRMVLFLGKENPKSVIIPPGIVHAYKNIGSEDGLVLNFPNRLYAGWKKKEPVDEIRYEANPDSPYQVD